MLALKALPTVREFRSAHRNVNARVGTFEKCQRLNLRTGGISERIVYSQKQRVEDGFGVMRNKRHHHVLM